MSERVTLRVQRDLPTDVGAIGTVVRCEFPDGADPEVVVREVFHAYAELMLRMQEHALAEWLKLPPDGDELSAPAVPLTESGSSS